MFCARVALGALVSLVLDCTCCNTLVLSTWTFWSDIAVSSRLVLLLAQLVDSSSSWLTYFIRALLSHYNRFSKVTRWLVNIDTRVHSDTIVRIWVTVSSSIRIIRGKDICLWILLFLSSTWVTRICGIRLSLVCCFLDGWGRSTTHFPPHNFVRAIRWKIDRVSLVSCESALCVHYRLCNSFFAATRVKVVSTMVCLLGAYVAISLLDWYLLLSNLRIICANSAQWFPIDI